MANIGVEANTNTYNAAISACEKAREWARALQLLSSMANPRVSRKILGDNFTEGSELFDETREVAQRHLVWTI
jgi:pentatricopeptide repeat protein